MLTAKTSLHAPDMDMDLLNKLSYRQRLFLWLIGYSLLMMAGFVIFQYHREKEFKVAEINLQLQLINTYILNELEEGKRMQDITLSDFKAFNDLRVSVISANGDVIYDNTLDSIHRTNHLDREEIRKALRSGTGYAVRRHSKSTGENYFYSASLGDEGYIVRTAVPYSLSLISLLKADFGFLWIMGAITIAMCIFGYFATRRVGQNIVRLKSFAENVEKGINISDTEPFPHDELGDISNHIVRLYARLQQAIADRDREHRAAMHEQQEKDRIKKQLTNNINHELKTPVASIQVCIETLLAHENMSPEKRVAFLQRCLAGTERLKRLLSDVSLITRMDDGGKAILKEQVNLNDIITEAVSTYQPIAQSKGIEISADIHCPVSMNGNRSLLESIFNNLFDNAIAYSGGNLIIISLISVANGKIAIDLQDNGTGVPEEHLPHLFERFYRIDKGRSRAAGGTGLGLSIVKNAVALHGGNIKVENLKAGGLAFRIVFSQS